MLNELKKLVIAQKMAVLLPEAPSPDLEALHTAVSNYDQVVSRTVIQAIQETVFHYPKEQVLQLQRELDDLFAGTNSNREVEAYRKYRQRLDQMISLVEEISQNQF
jgi:hypothetical protein